MSFCFLNGCEVVLSTAGIKVSNKGGVLKGQAPGGGLGEGGSLDEFLKAEEIALAVTYHDRYPKHRGGIYGEEKAAVMDDDDAPPEPPLLAFGYKFKHVAKALAGGGEVTLRLAGGDGHPCVLRGGTAADMVVAQSSDKPTLRGFLATLDEKLAVAP